MHIVISVCAIAVIGMASAVFVKSLPTWCANPQGSGNWAVQPLCKG